MDSNNQIDLTFTDFSNFKPLVFAKTKKRDSDHELRFVQVAIPVPNSSWAIFAEPIIEVDEPNKLVVLQVEVDGRGESNRAGHMLYFRMKPKLALPKTDVNDFELIVLVMEKSDDRPPVLGKSVLKTIDEDED